MLNRRDIFAGDDPFEIARAWLSKATETELNDPGAAALATTEPGELPNVRMVLVKGIEAGSFVFYTNYESVKAREIEAASAAALVMHWKTLRRQIRVRGKAKRTSAEESDAYFKSRPLQSRIGAHASSQSRPLASRAHLLARAGRLGVRLGVNPERPHNWGGYRILPLEIEFWANGDFRLHDRFRWRRETLDSPWSRTRLYP